MSELGDDYRYSREQRRLRRQREGWISNRFKTYEEQERNTKEAHEMQDKLDSMTMKTLKELKITAVRKGERSFQLQLSQGNVMFYSGKNGDFIYVPQTKQHIDVGFIEEDLLKAIKKIKPLTPPQE